MRVIRVSIVLLCICLSTAEFVSAGDEVARLADESPELRSRAEYLVRGIQSERERLVSGLFRIHGITETRAPRSIPDHDGKYAGDVHGLYAFDYAKGLFRYDNSEQSYVRAINAKSFPGDFSNLKSMVGQLTEIQLKSVRNSDYSASWTKDGVNIRSNLHLRRKDTPLPRLTGSTHHVCDVRAWGLMDFFDLQHQPRKTLAELCTDLLGRRVVSVEEKQGIAVIVFEDKFRKATLSVDVKHGFTPFEFVVASRVDPSVLTSKVQWAKISAVWVPMSCVIEMDVPHLEIYRQYSFKYEWEIVNQPVDASYFDYRSFTGIPKGTRVVDVRGDKPAIVGYWQGNGIVEAQRKPHVAPAPPQHPHRLLFVLCNALILALVGLVLYMKRRKSNAAS